MLLDRSIKSSDLKSSSFRGALLSSGVVGFAGLGDVMLYPILPVYGKDMGFSVFIIGLLLSVNRFIRIIANTSIANIVRHLGMKKVLIISSGIAAVTTLLYGLRWGIISFFVARIAWGLCYSGLKIASLNYAAKVKEVSGLAFGLSKSINSLIGIVALWLCPFIIAAFGIATSFVLIALVSLIGLMIAFVLPHHSQDRDTTAVKTRITFYPGNINLLVFVLSITIDGILVVVLADLLMSPLLSTSLLLAVVAFYLLLKRVFIFGVSLLSSFLTLRFRAEGIFKVSILICIIATLFIAFGYARIGIILAFLFNSIVVTYAPLIALKQQPGQAHSLQIISSISTWWDLGAALGAFLGIMIIQEIGQLPLFLTLSFFISVLFYKFNY